MRVDFHEVIAFSNDHKGQEYFLILATCVLE